MTSNWQEVAVVDLAAKSSNALATGPFGSAISSRFFEPIGVPVIRGSNLTDTLDLRLIDENLVFVSPAKASEFARSIVRRGDLIFTCWGTVGQVGLIDESHGQELGLSSEETAFYDALAENGSAREVMKSDTLRLMARELTEMVKKMPKLDWTERESVRATLRRNVRRLLARYGYPPDLAEGATLLVLRQAELSTENSQQ